MRPDEEHLDLSDGSLARERTRVVHENDPFIERPFLEAASLLPPARGRGLTMTFHDGAAFHRWGVVEMSRFGLKAAVAWARPMSDDGAGRDAAWPTLLEAVARRGHAVLRMTSHSTVRLTPADEASIERVAEARGWVARPLRFGTYVLDLRLPEEKRFQLLEANHRQAVRKTEAKGLELVRLGRDDLDRYMEIADATYTRQRLEPYPRAYFDVLIRREADFRFYAAVDRAGRHHAAAVIAVRGPTGIYLHGGSGNREVPGAGTWLHWKIANRLATDGFEAYDLGGVDIEKEDGKPAGIRNFKARFGGRFEEHRGLDVVFRPRIDAFLQNTLRLARRLRLV